MNGSYEGVFYAGNADGGDNDREVTKNGFEPGELFFFDRVPPKSGL